MSVYAIGDLHLSLDPRIEKPMDIFGDRWEDHHIRVKENWEEIISSEDTVIIPGDVSWGLHLDEAMADLEWIHELPGQKIITKGNHDLWWTSISKLNALFDDIHFIQNHAWQVAGTETYICGTRGWICPGTRDYDDHDEKIFRRELIRLEFSLKEAEKQGAENIICALHYPPTNDKLQPSEFTDMLERYGVKMCIYGHLHGKKIFNHGLKGTLNGVEYRLVSLDYLNCVPELIQE